MSIPIRLKFYDKHGQFMTERSIFTVSYGIDPSCLTELSNRLQQCSMEDLRRYIGEDVKYAVPKHVEDYMFDLEDPKEIMPNRFK